MKPRFLPKFPIFVQDILGSMRWRMMTAEERGGYMELLMLQWQEGGLPDDLPGLFRMAKVGGLPGDHPALAEAFPLCDDGQRRNRRCAQVRAEAEAFCDEQARKASLGGKAKAARGHVSGIAPACPEPAPPTPTPTPTPTPDASQNPTGSSKAADEPPHPRPPRRASTGPHADCIRHWESEWSRTRLGQEWAWQAKDAALISKALSMAGGNAQEVQSRTTRLLGSSDAWMAANAAPGILVSRWNQLAFEVRTNGNAIESPATAAVRAARARQNGHLAHASTGNP